MGRALITGLAAGAVGTAALNVVTYLDMVVRARSSSDVPAEVAKGLAAAVSLPLSADGPEGEAATTRASGIGALLGIATGLGVGVVVGVLRPAVPGVSRAAAAVAVGLTAMAASDVPATVLGVTDPTAWSAVDWASDVVPHLAFGWATVAAYDALATG